MLFYLIWLVRRLLLGEKVMALGTFFRKLWKFLRWEKCNTLIPTYLLPNYYLSKFQVRR